MLARRCILAAAFALTIATTAHADTVAPRRVVVVHVNGTPDETTALESTLRELLGRLELTMATGSAPASSVLESVTVDMTAAGAKVVVRSASGATVIDRLVRGESVAIQREQIAHAVRGACEAELLVDADRVAGRAPAVVDPPPAPPPAPPSPPPPVEPPPAPAPIVVVQRPPTAEAPVEPAKKDASLGLDIATFAGGGSFASDTSLVMRVGGSVTVASRRWLKPQLALAALYAFPFETTRTDPNSGDVLLSARSKVFSLRLRPGIEVLRKSWFGLTTSLGGGFDVLTVDPASNVPIDLHDSTTRVNPIFSGTVTARAEIAADVAVTLTAMLDVDPTSRSYVFQFGNATTEIFAPSSFRPMLLAGVSFAALGGGQ